MTCDDVGRTWLLLAALATVIGGLFHAVWLRTRQTREREARAAEARARAAEERYRRERAIDASAIAEQLARAAATSRPRLLS